MQEIRKHILDRFQEHIDIDFDTYCKRHGFDRNENTLITYLIDQELISGMHLQRYTVLKEFEKLHTQKAFQKTEVVSLLAHRFNISERTIWSILKRITPVTARAEARKGSARKKFQISGKH